MSVGLCFAGRIIRNVVIMFAVAVPGAVAQIGGQGAISGTISDPTGAVVANASVSATNTGTNAATNRPTTKNGYYLLSPLPPGDYTITVTAAGFRTLTQEHVTVDALQTVGYS